MIGYGQLMMDQMERAGFHCREFQMAGMLTSKGKLGRNLDRYLLSTLKMAGRRADVIHAVDPGSAIYFPYVRAGKRSATVHDMIPYLANAGRLEGFKPTRLGNLLMKSLIKQFKKCDGIAVVSENTKTDLVNLADICPDKIHVIPNAVFQLMVPATNVRIQSVLTSHKIPENKPIILNIGRNFYKNRRGVIEIFRILKHQVSNAHLVFVSSPNAELNDQIRRSNLTEDVSFISHVTSDELSVLYSAARALLFPSLYEGFGYPVLEAQMCDTPVVCSNAGSLPEVAGPAAAIFEPNDIEGMAAALVKIHDDREYAAELIELGRTNVEQFNVLRWQKAYSGYFTKLRDS